jgi:anti-sigma factor RsiW
MADQNHNPEHDEIEGPGDPQTAELVAYLDGELPEQDADRVEQLLLTNPPLRRNAETLDRTWQLLNSLEEATASGEFTQKTLASISTVSGESDADRSTDRRWSLKMHLAWPLIARGLIWCLAGFIACSAGLLLSRKARRERTDPTDAQILRDLDLYHQYPMIWRIPDVEFLKEISENARTLPVSEEKP